MPPKEGKKKKGGDEGVPEKSEWQLRYDDLAVKHAAVTQSLEEAHRRYDGLRKQDLHRQQAAAILKSEESQRLRDNAAREWQEERRRYHTECLTGDRVAAQHSLILRQESTLHHLGEEVRSLQSEAARLTDAELSRRVALQDEEIGSLRRNLRRHVAQENSVSAKQQRYATLLATAPQGVGGQNRRRALVISCEMAPPLPTLHHSADDAVEVADVLRAAGHSVEVLTSHSDASGAGGGAAFASTRLNILKRATAAGLFASGGGVVIYITCYAFRHATHGVVLVPSDATLPPDFAPLRRREASRCDISAGSNLLPLSRLLACVTDFGMVSPTILLDSATPCPAAISPAGGLVCAATAAAATPAYLAEYMTPAARLGHPPRQPRGVLSAELRDTLLRSQGSLAVAGFISHLAGKPAGRRWPLQRVPSEEAVLKEALPACLGDPPALVRGEGVDLQGFQKAPDAHVSLHLAVDVRIAPLLRSAGSEEHRLVQRNRNTFREWLHAWLATVLSDMGFPLEEKATPTSKQPLPVSITSVLPRSILRGRGTPFDPYSDGDYGWVEVCTQQDITTGTATSPPSPIPTSDATAETAELLQPDHVEGAPRWLVWGFHERRCASELTLVLVYMRRPKVSLTLEGWRERGVLQVACEDPAEVIREAYAGLAHLGGRPLASLMQGVTVGVRATPEAFSALDLFSRAAAGRLWDAVPRSTADATTQCRCPFDVFAAGMPPAGFAAPPAAAAAARPQRIPQGTLVTVRCWPELGDPETGVWADACVDGFDEGRQVYLVSRVERDGGDCNPGDGGGGGGGGGALSVGCAPVEDVFISDSDRKEAWEKWASLPIGERAGYAQQFGNLQRVKQGRDIGSEAELRAVSQHRDLHMVNAVSVAATRALVSCSDYYVVFVWGTVGDPFSTPPETGMHRMRAVAKSFLAAEPPVPPARRPVSFFYFCACNGGGSPGDPEGDGLGPAADFGFRNRQMTDVVSSRVFVMRPNSDVLSRGGVFTLPEYRAFVQAVLSGDLDGIGGDPQFSFPEGLRTMHISLA